MTLPHDYIERVYAGVLGKIIGVYLGRPFEGWPYEKIMQELGEINYYVHDKLNRPLVVTDDDISGTFTFLRALPDHGNSLDLTAEQIGKTWLNYLIERKTILWWGGLGNSTEHTAYLRLKHGIPAPLSGAIETNGKVVAEQIGAQIFIDGWAMVSPGDPERAADLARRAGSVSHDGEAVYGAQCLAAMEAQAFVEQDIDRLLDTGVSVIPHDSTIYRLVGDLREWYSADHDWRKTFARVQDNYGYDRYIGNCHMVPNHALIILGLLYGQGDFQRSLMVCNTCGWDTDCNSGNLGCLLGIRNGLAGFDCGVDWRGPVADRIYLPTMDGGRCVTDAVMETYHIVNMARALNGQPPVQPKQGARFHFEAPGSVQSFRVDPTEPCASQVVIENVVGHSQLGTRSLAVRYACTGEGAAARVTTPTFIVPEDLHMPGYSLIASPTIYPGQTLRAGVMAGEDNAGPVEVRLLLHYYGEDDQPARQVSPGILLQPGKPGELTWLVPDTEAMPIFAIGIEVLGQENSTSGAVFLDYLTWDGTPTATLKRPSKNPWLVSTPTMWRSAWVNAIDQGDPHRLSQNEGRGMVAIGTREWQDYRVSTIIHPAMFKSGGLAARVQGLQRYYALQLTGDGKVRLIKVYEGPDEILAEQPFTWEFGQTCALSLEAKGDRLRAWLDGQALFDVRDSALTSGAVGLVIEEGHMMAESVNVEPAA